MLGDDEVVLMLFKQCLDLDAKGVEALLDAQADPTIRAAVRALLRADQEPHEVENGFGMGALELLADTAANAPTEDVLPQSIGPYRVLRMAGAGGSAIVYEAMESVPRRRVAVKVARATLDPDLHPRFEAEAHALSRVRDEAIPVVYQVGSMVGLPWLAMEWVEGTQLDPMALEEPLTTLISVCRGMAAAHDAGVTHGDLSPANILLTDVGPKLVDFGLAGADGTSGPTGGTQGYRTDTPLQPDQVDLYALGCLIRECNRGSDPALDAIARAATTLEYASVRALWQDLRNRRDDKALAALPDTRVQSLQRWSRRFRAPIMGVLATALAAVVVVAGVQEVQRRSAAHELRRHNAEAMADLDAVLGQSPDGLDTALARWLEDRRWVDTSAVGRAWLERARLLASKGDVQASEDAAAQAFVVAMRQDDRAQAAQLLADRFIHEARWSSLLRLADATNTQAWRVAALAGQRDLQRAAEAADGSALHTLLSEWTHATRTEHRPTMLVEGEEPGTLLLSDEEAGFIRLVQAEPMLSVVASTAQRLGPRTNGLPFVIAGSLIAEFSMPESMVISRIERQGEDLVRTPLLAAPNAALDMVALQADDGPQFFAGYGYPLRDLLELTPDGTEVAHPATSAAHSDVGPFLAVDLPDGTPGLIAGVGAWRAYDLRLYRAQSSLELVERQEMGQVTALAILSTTPLVIAVGTSDKYGNSQVLGADTPFGLGRGVHLREVTATGLVDRGSLPGDVAFHEDETLRDIVPGDFDGDGLVDMAVRIDTSRGAVMWVLRNNGDGYDSLIIDDVVPMFARDVDGDGIDELFARLNGDNYHLWTLGAGDRPLPVLPTHAYTPLPVTSVPEPMTAVVQLSEMGLDRAAATLAERRASRLPPEHLAGSERLQGLLWQRVGDDQRAERHLRRALELGVQDDDSTRHRLAEVQASQLKFSQAHQTLEPLALTEASELRRRIQSNAPYAVAHVSFPEALKHARLDNLDGIRTPVVGPHLDLDLTATGGSVLSMDVQVSAPEFSVSYAMAVRRLELASGLYITLLDDVGEAWTSGVLSGSGGGREIKLNVGCSSEKLATYFTDPIANELDVDAQIHVQFSYNEQTQQARCRVRTADGPVVDHSWTLQAPRSPHLTLNIASPPPTTDKGTRADVRLSELTLRGLEVVQAQDSPEHHAGLLLLSGRYDEAIDAFSALGEPGWAALASLDGGYPARATPWLQNNPDHPLTQRLHRTRREVGPLLAAADPEHYAVRVERDFSSALRYTEAPDVAAVLLHPTLDALEPSTSAMCELMRRRAGVLTRLGRPGPSLSVLDRIGHQETNTELENCKVAADIHAAELLIGMGRQVDAHERILRAVATSSIPDITRERLRRHPLLKDYVDP